ncbi:alpha-ketoglutarate-dependent taurine dioxygenase-like [Lineus longissimus]|uniref:alpha-ketoglutarate-dependent taurine dioxygenase-like n=1 Tax=Lineus longissimus TaxID=88925 RepID=UPI00315E01EC
MISHNYYTIKPLKLGVECRGLDLSKDVPDEVIEQLKKDVHTFRLMVFRDQGILSGSRHVEIGRWFGEPESTFYKHPKSPHPDVFRVSNDEAEGCTGVGRTGWHIDGSFQPAPFAYSLYHMVAIPKTGDTVFAPMNEIIEGLPPEKRDHWERLSMMSDRRQNSVHPLIYSHPVTRKRTLCFHIGMIDGFVYDYGKDGERYTSRKETIQILKELHHEFVKDNGAIQYSHKWKPGDFIFSDNLAVAHEASPHSQLPREEAGLRVLHRVTIKGTRAPKKDYDWPPREKEEL